MTRRLAVLGIVLVLTAALAGACRMPAPGMPSMPRGFGVRVTDGQLRVWTGSMCTKVTQVIMMFSPGSVRSILEPPANEWANVDHLTVGGPYPGLTVVEPLPAGFDWRKADSMTFVIDSGPSGGAAEIRLAEVFAASAEHPDDTYYFDGIGWLSPADVKERDGKDILTTCTPDPAKTPSLPPAFGVRVTDGKLRIWTGSLCREVNGVTLWFRPDAARPGSVDWRLGKPTEEMTELERFTVGEPVPGLAVTTPLPDGFDWRRQQSFGMDVHSLGPHEPSETDLTEVINGSAAHPDDTYWFQGVGWLNPAQVAEQNGKTFLATCTPDPAK